MTIATALRVDDGVVLASDSATTLSRRLPDGRSETGRIYNNANKPATSEVITTGPRFKSPNRIRSPELGAREIAGRSCARAKGSAAREATPDDNDTCHEKHEPRKPTDKITAR